MATLTPDEKTTLIMAYTHDTMVRGEAVSRQSVRVSIWLRTDGAPHYFRLLNAQQLFFGAGAVKSSTHAEIYVPVATVIAFHMVPPAADPMDYEEGEKNRAIQQVTVSVGSFIFKGSLRFSAQSGLQASLEMVHGWLSMYDTEITNPSLPQMPAITVPMLLVNPAQVAFAL